MEKTLLGARVPNPLIGDLKKFCQKHGLKISYFVSEAIQEKLEELKEDEEDIATVEARESEPVLSEKEWNEYLRSRDLDV